MRDRAGSGIGHTQNEVTYEIPVPFFSGTRPADVCGWRSSHTVKAANSLRTVAELISNFNVNYDLGPTGAAVRTYSWMSSLKPVSVDHSDTATSF